MNWRSVNNRQIIVRFASGEYDVNGCQLIEDEIAHYQKIVVTLNETIRIMSLCGT